MKTGINIDDDIFTAVSDKIAVRNENKICKVVQKDVFKLVSRSVTRDIPTINNERWQPE